MVMETDFREAGQVSMSRTWGSSTHWEVLGKTGWGRLGRLRGGASYEKGLGGLPLPWAG